MPLGERDLPKGSPIPSLGGGKASKKTGRSIPSREETMQTGYVVSRAGELSLVFDFDFFDF
jgi:hypothetical protein